jgi:putative addiction module component (TIGR02574 family)
MTALAQSLLEQAMELSPNDRAFLVNRLMESLDPPGEDLSPDAWHAAVVAELESRQAAAERGELKAIPWEEFEQRLEKRLGGQ